MTKWFFIVTVVFTIMANAMANAQELSRERLIGDLQPITGEEARAVDLNIEFRLGSANLTERAMRQLDLLGSALTPIQPKTGGLK